MNFWIIITVLISSACALVFFAVSRKPSPDPMNNQDARIKRNVGLYLQRLDKLRQQKQEAYYSDDEFEAFCNEMGRQLLNDVTKLEKTGRKVHFSRAYYFIAVLPLLAIVLYQALGAYPDWKIKQSLQALSGVENQQQFDQEISTLHDQMLARLHERPDNIDYRILLARYAMGKQDYREAVIHYGVLAELLPTDAEVLGFYTQALYLAKGRQVDEEVQANIDNTLQINPHQSTVLGLQGIYAFETGDFAAAIDSWQKLLRVLEPDSPQFKMIEEGIDQAKKNLGIDLSIEKPDKTVKGLTVKVSADESLSDLDKNLLVYVYAKAASGPPMPLAVKRLLLKDLPADVWLDDSMAMMPQMRLTQYEDVIVGARVSFSGEPVSQNGDWQGESDSINWQAKNTVEILISEQVVK